MRVFLIFDLLSAITWSNSIHTWRKIPPLLNIKRAPTYDFCRVKSCLIKDKGRTEVRTAKESCACARTCFFTTLVKKACTKGQWLRPGRTDSDSIHKTWDKQLNQTLKVTYCHKKPNISGAESVCLSSLFVTLIKKVPTLTTPTL